MGGIVILLPILIPLVGTIVVALLKKVSETVGSVVTALFCALTLGTTGWLLAQFNQGADLSFAVNIGLPFKLAFNLDALGVYMGVISAAVWFLAAIYSIEYIHERRTIFNAFMLLSLYGMLGITTAANLFTLLFFFEVFSVASAVLVIHEMTPEANRAGFQYLIISIVGSAAIILASAAIYSLTGSMDLTGHGIAGLAGNPLTPLLFWLLIIGFAIKAGIFPFHVWLPVAHPIAPSSASALLSGVMIKAGAYGIIRVIYGVFGIALVSSTGLATVLLWLAVFTMIYGSIMAIAQTELKRLLAYSSVAQIGYVILGAALLTSSGLKGGVLHILAHAMMKGALFLSAGIIIHQTGLRKLSDLDGIGQRLPWTMTAFTMAAVSMIGVPPFIGFFSKWYLALGALQAKDAGSISQWSAYGIVGAIILSGLLNIVYYAPIIIRGWFGGPAPQPAHSHGEAHGHATVATANDGGHPKPATKTEPSWLMLAPVLTLAFGTLLMGLYIKVPLGLINDIVGKYF
jgi:multicomponent Na+:H+ antiporter subunit D